ncbi:hypothetical protein BDQ17DRAFT_1336706 [Cyathus striatus]|nr:hypothetical protein BDQ17DRAFT_1336706 [Cyathus striatus]
MRATTHEESSIVHSAMHNSNRSLKMWKSYMNIKNFWCALHLNAARSIKQLQAHKLTWTKLLNIVGTQDVPALHRVFQNAKSFKWSIKKTLEMIQDAVNGKYHAKGFSELELDLANIIYDLGGQAALHALHHSPFAFPLRKTLTELQSEYNLRVSTGKTIADDLRHNMEVVLNGEDDVKLVGVTLCIDEVASDGRLSWISTTDDIVGLCHEHISNIESTKMGPSLDVIYAISEAVRDGRVHIEQEILVAALGCNDNKDYGAKPILILPMCLDKLLCSQKGVLINDTLINKNAIQALLDWKDPQDVPRAIKLLSLIPELHTLDWEDMSPSELQTHNAFCLLGEMLEALLQPFINPDYTISEQIISLVKFAHILYALFKKHETAFMPAHLYSDFQCTFHAAIHWVACTKKLDPEHHVLLCLLGDDILERLFGHVRMAGGHSPNVAADEFCQHASAAVRLGDAFYKYPEWEQKPHWLMLKHGRDADHLTPQQ